jgi:type 1 glutamine amidotransferase
MKSLTRRIAFPILFPISWALGSVVFIISNSLAPGQHEHRAGCKLLAEQLNRSGLPIEAVVTTDGWPEEPPVFNGASAVIIYTDGGAGHPAMKRMAALKAMAAAAVGIGCSHYAVEVPKEEPGNSFLDLIGGYFETDWSVNPHWDASFKIPKHEITRGIKDFQIRDEWYYHMRFRENMQGVTPILSDLPPPASLTRKDGPHEGNPAVRAAVLDRKEAQHVMWAYERPAELGGGRTFGFTGGHFHKHWKHDDHRRIVLNAAAWIANLGIPRSGLVSKTPTNEEMNANLDPK